MNELIKKVKNIFFEKAKPLSPGNYHYHTPNDTVFPYRLHLRIDMNGDGLLILNASTVMHLNQTATEFAYHIINQTPKNEVLESIIARYQITYTQANEDFNNFINRIETLISTPDLDPVSYLDFEREKPFGHELSAPYRLDCAITYKLHEDLMDHLTPSDRVKRELSTQEWKQVLDTAWKAGIPHVIFTGGEPTLRQDLVELAKYSEELGQVTGILSNGLRLNDSDYLDDLLNAGIDHLMLSLDIKSDLAWSALEKVLSADIYTTVHITATNENQEELLSVINRLKEFGLENISISTNDLNLRSYVNDLRNKCAESGLNLVWNLPVPYSQFNPINLEIENEIELVDGAGKGWLYVEPDGDVLPSQGINNALGNLLVDPWDQIWTKAKNFSTTI